MKWPQQVYGQPVGGRIFTRRQRVWLLWGAGLGAVLVGLWQWPRWTAWLDWWQRAPLPMQQPPLVARDAAATWAQHEAGLDDAQATMQHWRALHERLAQQGLKVLQWQVIEGPPPKPGVWPLVVQRARLQLQGNVAAWPAVARATPVPGSLWRLERLSGQAHAGEGGLPVWRWQAEWALALRPAQGPVEALAQGQASELASASARAAGPAPTKGPAAGLWSGQGPIGVGALRSPDDGPWANLQPAQADPGASAAQRHGQRQVRGQGLHITDWPLSQLQWVGLWTAGGVHEAVFRAQDRLFRVRPGEAVGQDGHRWMGGDGRELVLQGPGAAVPVLPLVSAPWAGLPSGSDAVPSKAQPSVAAVAASTTTVLIWEGKP